MERYIGNRTASLLKRPCLSKTLSKLRDVLSQLIAAEPLPPRLKDHPLTGDWGAYRDCHIEPDWLLLYKIDGNDLILARTGTHADLFR